MQTVLGFCISGLLSLSRILIYVIFENSEASRHAPVHRRISNFPMGPVLALYPPCAMASCRRSGSWLPSSVLGPLTHVSLLLASVSLGNGYFHLVMRPTSPDMKVR